MAITNSIHVYSEAWPVLAACDKAVDVQKLSRTRRPPTAGRWELPAMRVWAEYET